jgi:hypothetical protein
MTYSPYTKVCPKCGEADQTDLAKCQFCGSSYSTFTEQPDGPSPSVVNNFIIIGSVLFCICAWFIFGGMAVRFDSTRWMANKGDDRYNMSYTLKNHFLPKYKYSWRGSYDGDPAGLVRKELGIPDESGPYLVNGKFPGERWSYSVTHDGKVVSYFDVFLVDGHVYGTQVRGVLLYPLH